MLHRFLVGQPPALGKAGEPMLSAIEVFDFELALSELQNARTHLASGMPTSAFPASAGHI